MYLTYAASQYGISIHTITHYHAAIGIQGLLGLLNSGQCKVGLTVASALQKALVQRGISDTDLPSDPHEHHTSLFSFL